jgi:hypothetical protein
MSKHILGLPTKLAVKKFELKKNKIYKIKRCKEFTHYLRCKGGVFFLEDNINLYFEIIKKEL